MTIKNIEVGRSIDFTFPLTIASTIDIDENTLSMKINLPDNYPETPLRQHLRKQGEPLASLELSIEDHVLFLDMFFVNTYDSTLLPEETKATRGLGKIMLCKAIREMIDHDAGRLLPAFDQIEIHLEAMGGMCKPNSREELLEMIKRYRPSIPDKIEKLGFNELVHVCAIEKTRNLCKYYAHIYGLHVVDDKNPLEIYMKGYVKDLIKGCS